MERLTHKELFATLAFLRGLYATDGLPAFIHHVIYELPKLVPCETSAYNEVDPIGQKITSVLNPPETPLPDLGILEKYMGQHPVINYHQKTRDGQAKKISDFLTRKEYHRLVLYNEFYRHVDVEDQIAVVLPTASSHIIGIVLNRSRRDFTERDRLKLNLLRPHLVQAYHNAVAASRVRQELTLEQEINDVLELGVIVLGGEMHPRLMTPRARHWLETYFTNPSRRADALPDALQEWVREQQSRLSEQDQFPEPIRPWVLEREGKQLVIRILPDPYQTILILQQRRTASRPQDLQPLGLTPREAEVLFWVAQGKTNAEAGSILATSTRTIGKHLERIYQKLGVETRTAAAMLALTFLT
jgi:DNA-binding CsgD family transcriptional regulator